MQLFKVVLILGFFMTISEVCYSLLFDGKIQIFSKIFLDFSVQFHNKCSRFDRLLLRRSSHECKQWNYYIVCRNCYNVENDLPVASNTRRCLWFDLFPCKFGKSYKLLLCIFIWIVHILLSFLQTDSQSFSYSSMALCDVNNTAHWIGLYEMNDEQNLIEYLGVYLIFIAAAMVFSTVSYYQVRKRFILIWERNNRITWKKLIVTFNTQINEWRSSCTSEDFIRWCNKRRCR